jgi:hypothetical protein
MYKRDKMNNKPIPMSCENFNVRKCPHHKKELMQEYITKTRAIIGETRTVTEGFSLASKVYGTFCENCESKNFNENQTECLE